jgi:catechol 2,3-dioxygenase-like lactoylglutathione lyase family enzyme
MFSPVIDSVFLAVPDPEAACEPYRRLGLHIPDEGARPWRTLAVGTGEHLFSVHFLPQPEGVGLQPGLFTLALRVPDVTAAHDELKARGVAVKHAPPLPVLHVHPEDCLWLHVADQAGTDLLLVPDSPATGAPSHTLELKRLDHLAVVAHDLEARTRYWTDTLGVPVAGEVVTPTMVIRQLRMGAVLELLGAASADSPIHRRPAGLVNVASWEVADLAKAVAIARAAGFTAPDPAPGPLPGTHISTIPGEELAGVNMQLLQYV